jgi:aminopeptidase N
MPLSTGTRGTVAIRSAKGTWVLHMLRFLMLDIETNSDAKFWRFMHELSIICNQKAYTNDTFVKMAEKHYGQPLGFFFDHWLYGFGIPEYKIDYSIEQREGLYYITGTSRTEGVPDDFNMPVVLRIVGVDGNNAYLRHSFAAGSHPFELGPIGSEPKELVFNEFFSVLSKDKVNRK